MDNQNNLKVCSLFAGIGGIDLGFMQNGFDIVWANEIDSAACKTYTHNHKNSLIKSDIREIDPKNIPDFDVLVGGFPCQPFSIAGLKKGFKDPRGNLFFEIAKFIDIKRPEVVFLENVENLIHHDNGKTFLVIYSTLAQFGYTVRYKIMSPTEYANIPQPRKRTFVIAFLDYEKCRSFCFPTPIESNSTVNTIIDRSIKQNDIYYYTENDSLFKSLNSIVTDTTSVYKIKDSGVFKYKNHLCPTLTANMGTFPNRVPVIRDDYGVRKLTLRECLAFQGFPKDFYFPNTITINDAYKQIGNSVCVPIITSLAKQIKNII